MRCHLAFLASFLASGCAAKVSDPPTIEGAEPEEAADIVAEVACGYYARCGTIAASCEPCSIDDPECELQCSVTAAAYPESECLADLVPALEVGFGCEALTPTEIETVDACLAAVPDNVCPTVEAVEAWVDGGRQGRDPREPIEACDLLLDDIVLRCGGGE